MRRLPWRQAPALLQAEREQKDLQSAAGIEGQSLEHSFGLEGRSIRERLHWVEWSQSLAHRLQGEDLPENGAEDATGAV
jgi:hypothetical protein